MHTKLQNILSSAGVLLLVVALYTPMQPAQAQVANPNAGVEAKVREYFADIPVMIDIAKCETSFRQYTASGETLKDPTGSYIGLFQIDEQAHFIAAWGQNFNLYTLEGNMGYARYLYGKIGTRPWKGCVPAVASTVPAAAPASANSAAPSSTSPASLQVTRNLRMGMSNSEVRTLQQILNKAGFVIASSGPGSPGNETEMFGSLTREALRKFQCAKGIVCDGNEALTGFGRVGPMTRAALNAVR